LQILNNYWELCRKPILLNLTIWYYLIIWFYLFTGLVESRNFILKCYLSFVCKSNKTCLIRCFHLGLADFHHWVMHPSQWFLDIKSAFDCNFSFYILKVSSILCKFVEDFGVESIGEREPSAFRFDPANKLFIADEKHFGCYCLVCNAGLHWYRIFANILKVYYLCMSQFKILWLVAFVPV
jgi:hypothetical protein